MEYIGWSDYCDKCKNVCFKEDEMWCLVYCPDVPNEKCIVCKNCPYFEFCFEAYYMEET